MKIGQIPLASIIHFATLGKTITSEKCNSSTSVPWSLLKVLQLLQEFQHPFKKCYLEL